MQVVLTLQRRIRATYSVMDADPSGSELVFPDPDLSGSKLVLPDPDRKLSLKAYESHKSLVYVKICLSLNG